MLNKLIDILHQETTLYTNLLSLLQEERRLLSRRVTDELHHLANMIETMVFRIKALERLRDEVVRGLAISYGLAGADSPSMVNLSRIIECVEEPFKGRLKTIQLRLITLIDSIKELNQGNSIIIGRGIENIKTAFLFLQELYTPQTYQSSGRLDGSPLSQGV